MLDGLLHPHSSIPYVQTGRSIALYTVSLLSRDSCERAFIGQLRLCVWGSSPNRHLLPPALKVKLGRHTIKDGRVVQKAVTRMMLPREMQ